MPKDVLEPNEDKTLRTREIHPKITNFSQLLAMKNIQAPTLLKTKYSIKGLLQIILNHHLLQSLLILWRINGN